MKRQIKKTIITLSRLNGTGVQIMTFTKLEPDQKITLEGEKYTILYKRVGKKEKYSKR